MTGNRAVSRLLNRQPATTANTTGTGATPTISVSDWLNLRGGNPREALRRAPEIVAHLTAEEATDHGAEIVNWLERQGSSALAERVLTVMAATWQRRRKDIAAAQAAKAAAPAKPFPSDSDAYALLNEGRDLATAGRHHDATQVLSHAFLLMQIEAERASNDRQDEITADKQEPRRIRLRRPVAYGRVSQLYGWMRELFAVYPKLARSLRAAGRGDEAERADRVGQRLRTQLREQFTLHDETAPGGLLAGAAMVAEVEKVSGPEGDALRLEGHLGETTDLTELPGLKKVSDFDDFALQTESLNTLTEQIAEQVDLIDALLDRPEIARAFPDGDIDMHDRDTRVKVWSLLLQSLRASRHDDKLALSLLMALMQRYLSAFTVHTQYNIRDFGTPYLTSDLPEDLAGRAERDCGVYAMYAAYEVFMAARTAGGPTLDFSLVSVPGHVMLAIEMRGEDATWVVNNDSIQGPNTGPVADLAARFVPSVFGRRFMITPAMVLPVGSTDMKVKPFADSLWSGLLDSSSWGLDVGATPKGASKAKLRQLTLDAYQNFYGAIEEFDKQCTVLEAGLNKASGHGSLKELQSALSALRPVYLKGAKLFLLLAQTSWAGDRRRTGVEGRLRGHDQYLFSQPAAQPPHPLLRTAMALARLQLLGGTLDAPETDLVALLTSKLAPSEYAAAFKQYVQAGMPAKF